MKKSIVCVLSVAAVMGAVLTSTAASAAVTANAPAGGDPDTTVTFTVTTGGLDMTAPAAVNLGSGAPGTTITHALGVTEVTDNRALLAATWTATASSTDFTTGTSPTSAQTIPATAVGYDPGAITAVGTITAAGIALHLSGAAQTVVTGTAGVGDNSATWDPTLAVAVPASAVGGPYSGILTQSVS